MNKFKVVFAFFIFSLAWAVPVEAQSPPRSFLLPGQSLMGSSDEHLVAGDMRFVMQHDCNLVLYLRGKAAWATNTNGKGQDCIATMQEDGNFVLLRGGDRKVLWAAGTDKHPGAWVVAQTDGNLVIYLKGPPTKNRALWNTSTFFPRLKTASKSGAHNSRFAGCAFARTSMKCIGVLQMCQAVWSCGFNPGSASPIERKDNWNVCGACFGLTF